jgi:hypothetical protein
MNAHHIPFFVFEIFFPEIGDSGFDENVEDKVPIAINGACHGMKMQFNPKQVQDRVDEIRAALKQLTDTDQGPPNAQLQVMGHIGELSVALSKRAEIASQRLDHLTRWLIGLTIALTLLTVVLAVENSKAYKGFAAASGI